MFFSAHSAISAFFTRIFDHLEISTNLGSKWTHMKEVGGLELSKTS